MDKLSSLITTSFQKKSVLGRQVQAAMVVEFANEKIVEFWGNKAKELAKALHLKSGVLTFGCANSIMAQELKFKQMRLTQAINAKFSAKPVKKIKIVQKGIELKEDL
ncbi:MAG: DciA family protein [Parcubacteria group bacterium]